MSWFLYLKRVFLCILAVSLLVCNIALPTTAADGDISEEETYVLNRDGNGEQLYLFQSPSMLGYDLNNQYGYPGKSVQAFVYTMYNSATDKHFPTYCVDIHVPAKQGANYRRLNLEDSSYSAAASGVLRAILSEGFYIIPEKNESDTDLAARVSARTAALGKAAGVENLLTGEAIAATQAAIWQIAHGPYLSFPSFSKSIYNPRETKYSSMCNYLEMYMKGTAAVNANISAVFDYLVALDPLPATEKTVAPSSFTELHDPVYTLNADGSYNVTVNTVVYVEMAAGDSLTLTAKLGNDTAETALVNGKQAVSLTLKNVPASVIDQEVKLSISGYQTSKGYFLFDASGERTSSQTMVGYDDSRLPVYAEVIAKEDRILNLNKLTTVKVGETSYENKPLSGIFFDAYLVATMEEYKSGAVKLPENPADYKLTYASSYVPIAEEFAFTITTDRDGKASVNLLHLGLPDGVYILKEQPHPSIVSPIEPVYIYIPSIDPNTKEEIYNITLWPKNEVKGGVYIEKNVISLGNDKGYVNAAEAHTWIIGTTIPEDLTSGKSFVVSDTLDSQLDYLGNLKVVLETKEGTEVEVLLPDMDYTLTVVDVDSLSEEKPSDSFKVALTGQGMTKLVTTIGTNDFADYMLRIYFDAQINANATLGTKIPNQAEVAYRNAVNFEFTSKSEKPGVYTGGLNLLKVDADNNQKTLSGATFELYRPATMEESLGNDPRLTTIAGVSKQVIQVPFHVGATLEGEAVMSVTTGADGKVSMAGLAYGTYYLLETVAPSGYALPTAAFEITVDGKSHNQDRYILVTNDASGAILPETGGMGTTVFTASGMVLLGVAVILFCVMRHRHSEGVEAES